MVEERVDHFGVPSSRRDDQSGVSKHFIRSVHVNLRVREQEGHHFQMSVVRSQGQRGSVVTVDGVYVGVGDVAIQESLKLCQVSRFRCTEEEVRV